MVHYGLIASGSASSPLRVCVVSYLNTVPLVWGMLHGAQRGLFGLDFDIPSRCADKLAAGEVDIGIVPVAEVPRLGLEVIPGAGVACHGEVRSILLISKVPPGEIRALASDTSSRSSVALSRIILRERYRAQPTLVPMPPDLPSMLEVADAALIIGDPALRIDPATLPYTVLDLGAEWVALTGLPMVFAVWARRKSVSPGGLAQAFLDSARFGLAHLDEIVLCESEKRGLSRELARDYLVRNLVMELGELEYRGMRRFLEYIQEPA
jgi:predicted solute-binding protein